MGWEELEVLEVLEGGARLEETVMTAEKAAEMLRVQMS